MGPPPQLEGQGCTGRPGGPVAHPRLDSTILSKLDATPILYCTLLYCLATPP